MPETQNRYTAADIQVLEGLEAVRRRPSMYIGSTDERGLHHLVYEIVDNSIDEAMAGFCDHIDIVIMPDGSVRVSDNGRGIPIDKHPRTGKSALETVMTYLHAGGKFDSQAYKVAGGLHGVGAAVVNALSSHMWVEVTRDGKLYRQDYERGKAAGELKVSSNGALHTGTTTWFIPDSDIFGETQFNFSTLTERFREMAFLTKGIWIHFVDERVGHSALTRVLNDYARRQKILKDNDPNLSGEDTREGLVAVVSVKLPEPQFEGQTKTRLGNADMKGIVESALGEELGTWLEEHPSDARRIIEKCLTAQRARDAARKARDLVIKKGFMDDSVLPGKLADCSERNPEVRELYLVEGPSAGGSAKEGRDRRFQAILPLRGKILNVEKARPDKMLAHEEIKAIITALGAGFGEDLDLAKLRYHRVIIMTDADVDGAHIRTLLLTFFFRYMRDLIERGHLYIAQPPLYRVQYRRDVRWFYSDKERDAYLSKLKDGKGVTIQRYKGLGEMNPNQLWETTMDPDIRTVLSVNVEDAMRADTIFTQLMGEEVAPRKSFIQSHYDQVRNLDV